MLAALARLRVDANQGQDARHQRLDSLAAGLGVVEQMLRWRIEALKHRERSSRAAARRVDRHLDGLVQTADAVARLAALGQPIGPLLRRPLGELFERDAVAFGGVGLDPRQEVGRRGLGNDSSTLARSPLGSMTSVGMPSIAASSMRSMSRPVLPLPVMPTQTAWVVNRRASIRSGGPAVEP